MNKFLKTHLTNWLTKESAYHRRTDLSDFDRLRHLIHPCDVLLVEGRSRISRYIRHVTGSPWTHAALYIGHMQDIDDKNLKALVARHYKGNFNEALAIESQLGSGTVIIPVNKYDSYHIRIARPQGITHRDAQRVIAHAIHRLGSQYDIKNVFDLVFLLAPWWLVPKCFKRFKLSHPSETKKEICSTMIAEAFQSIRFPILPLIHRESEKGKKKIIPKHPRLFTPSDFDFSPFFEIIKYPIVGLAYKHMPWDKDGVYYDQHQQATTQQADNKIED